MPNTAYDPNYGVRDESTAGELAAERMRDFLFRQRLADQQAAGQERELTSRERMNGDNLATQAALQGQALDAQRDINGSFNDRSAAETALANLKESGLTGRARIANEPQLGALGLQRDAMSHQWNKEDNTPDAMINRALAAAIAKQTGASMPSAPGSSVPAAIVPDGPGSYGHGATPFPVSRGTSGGYDTDRDGGGPMDSDHDGDPATAPSQRFAGPGQYQFDDKSGRTMASMLDQLKGSVPPERFDQAVAMLDNSNKQRSQRDLDAMDAKAAAAKASAASPATAPTAGAPGAPISLQELVKLQNQLKTGINPDAAAAARAQAIKDQDVGILKQQAQADFASPDPERQQRGFTALQALGVPVTEAMKPVPTTAQLGQKKLQGLTDSNATIEAIKLDPAVQALNQQIKQAASNGDAQALIGSVAKLKESLKAYPSITPDAADALVRQVLESTVPQEGGVFAGAPWRRSTQLRNALGLPQPGLMDFQ